MHRIDMSVEHKSSIECFGTMWTFHFPFITFIAIFDIIVLILNNFTPLFFWFKFNVLTHFFLGISPARSPYVDLS